MKIILKKGQKLFFTSDTHFGHRNICRGTSSWNEDSTRPFETIEDMDRHMIDGINDIVGENDILFHLGDFSFDGFEHIGLSRSLINCRNLHLILGNHDHHIRKNKDNIQRIFSSVNDYLHLQVSYEQENQKKLFFVLCHYPIASWDGLRSGTMHLHGHVHFKNGMNVGPGMMLDVGMDGNGLEIWTLEQVVEILENRPRVSLFKFDHHVSD